MISFPSPPTRDLSLNSCIVMIFHRHNLFQYSVEGDAREQNEISSEIGPDFPSKLDMEGE